MIPEGKTAVLQIPMSVDLAGREKIRVMLLARGYELAEWARVNGFLPSQVSMTLAGSRPYLDIRDRLCGFLEMSREDFDSLVPLPESVAPAAV